MVFDRDYAIMEHCYSIVELSSSQPKENSETISGACEYLDSRIYDPLVYFFGSSEICLDSTQKKLCSLAAADADESLSRLPKQNTGGSDALCLEAPPGPG